MKRHAEPVKKENMKSLVMFGDLSHLPVDHLSSLVDTVSSTRLGGLGVVSVPVHSRAMSARAVDTTVKRLHMQDM